MPAEARTRAGSVTEGTGIAAPGRSDEIRLRCFETLAGPIIDQMGPVAILNNDRLHSCHQCREQLKPHIVQE
jgi:hypothetical protein